MYTAMKFLFILVFFTAVTTNFCAAQLMDVIPGNTGVYSGIHTNDLVLLSQSEVVNTNNTDVSGSPFWNEEWKAAVVYIDNYMIFIPKVKLNLYTNDVWYTTPSGVVMTAKKEKVKGITFFTGPDTTRVLANFAYLKNGDDNTYRYYEFMNAGKAHLVKLNTVTLNKGLFDPFTGKSEMNYVTQTAYYLYYNATITLLKGDNRETIFSVLQPGSAAKEWLDKSKNKLKSNADILLFLNYFNTQRPG